MKGVVKTLNDRDCNDKIGHSGVVLFWRDSLGQYVKPLNWVNSDRICANRQVSDFAVVGMPYYVVVLRCFAQSISDQRVGSSCTRFRAVFIGFTMRRVHVIAYAIFSRPK
jgi:hypothetical protein